MRPGLPLPGIRMVAPSCTPAGILTLMLRVLTSVPLPRHCVQGVGMMRPLPPHWGQVWLNEKTPWFWATTPVPLQVGQTSTLVPGSAPDAATARAGSLASDRDRGGDTVDGVVEGLGQLGRDVGPTLRTAPATSAAATEAGEDVSEAAAKEATEIFHPDSLAGAERVPLSVVEAPICPRLDQAAKLVVFLALFGVGEDSVGLGHLLEALLGRRVAGVGVGVVLLGELAIGAFDLIAARRPCPRRGSDRSPCRPNPDSSALILSCLVSFGHLMAILRPDSLDRSSRSSVRLSGQPPPGRPAAPCRAACSRAGNPG